MPFNIPLIIIYNHKIENNIEILERLYAHRFSKIYHIMPFYRGEKKNVIPVYENSLYFQGYVAQAFKHFYNFEFSHYLFVGDDLLLNPVITEKSIAKYLNIDSVSNFIPNLYELHKRPINQFWSRIRLAYEYQTDKEGIEISNEIPSYQTALKKIEKFALTIGPLKFSQVYGKPGLYLKSNHIKDHLKKMVKWIQCFPNQNNLNLRYPLIGSYSDIFLISQNNIKDFCHYCGVFAAGELFVEFAIPTAIALTSEKIVTEKEISLKGKALWTEQDYKVLEKFDKNLDKLMTEFPENWLYVHPIKLSKWNNE